MELAEWEGEYAFVAWRCRLKTVAKYLSEKYSGITHGEAMETYESISLKAQALVYLTEQYIWGNTHLRAGQKVTKCSIMIWIVLGLVVDQAIAESVLMFWTWSGLKTPSLSDGASACFRWSNCWKFYGLLNMKCSSEAVTSMCPAGEHVQEDHVCYCSRHPSYQYQIGTDTARARSGTIQQ